MVDKTTYKKIGFEKEINELIQFQKNVDSLTYGEKLIIGKLGKIEEMLKNEMRP